MSIELHPRNAEEIENWMLEKTQLAEEHPGQELANIQSKFKKHQAFEAELKANSERVDAILAMGRNLIQRGECNGSAEAVEDRMTSISEQWQLLTQKSNEKSIILGEANRQRTFIAATKDLDFWLGEMESLLNGTVSGKDLASVQHLMRKHQVSTTNTLDVKLSDYLLLQAEWIKSKIHL